MKSFLAASILATLTATACAADGPPLGLKGLELGQVATPSSVAAWFTDVQSAVCTDADEKAAGYHCVNGHATIIGLQSFAEVVTDQDSHVVHIAASFEDKDLDAIEHALEQKYPNPKRGRVVSWTNAAGDSLILMRVYPKGGVVVSTKGYIDRKEAARRRIEAGI